MFRRGGYKKSFHRGGFRRSFHRAGGFRSRFKRLRNYRVSRGGIRL